MDLVGRNYAMGGGMDSSPEISLCNEAIFGTDADVISWDFGMIDERSFWKMQMYAYRTGVHRNRPMHVAINVDGRKWEKHVEIIKEVQDNGLAAMYLTRSIWDDIKPALPDTTGLSKDEMLEIPPFVRHFRCGDRIEKGSPTCDENKYNNGICSDRKHKAAWHPGW
mmetsp:Transcript_6763/g.15481  ORF Transcript_6763/g.15481 Transcript_6763/m.15481 type:complete len:166 (+) Transcript_6763:3-500(+)